MKIGNIAGSGTGACMIRPCSEMKTLGKDRL